MPLISQIGRKSLGVRALVGGIYVVLLAGAVTMVYPFLIMLAGSTKTGVDVKEFVPVPTFWHDDTALYRKHVEGLFNESLDAMRIAYDDDTPSFEKAEPPEAPSAALVAEWDAFLDAADLPTTAYAIGYINAGVSKSVP
ncbi:MAG: hypothetical protein IMZ66_01305, partial [Planctomycetes bacterium]|nr:hypothetical protein [Planctomycetota bacterium]